MKLIFLDIDGVLNCETYYVERHRKIISGEITFKEVSSYPKLEFCPDRVKLLNHIIEQTGAEVVLSSTWRIGRTHSDILNLFNIAGIKCRLYGVTPRLNTKRGLEIKAFLDNSYTRLVSNYIIIDDDTDMLLEQKDNFFNTPHPDGLTEEISNNIIKFLNK